jgi:putative acetyltransferase
MNLSFRNMEPEDAPSLISWLNDPEILPWFPMCNEKEIEDAVRIWLGYAKRGATLSVDNEGVIAGFANLYIQPFEKLSHNCLFAIIIDKKQRGKGIGGALLQELMKLAKDKFKIEILHLEVYEGNPAIRLYRRNGFKEYGYQAHFIKEMGKYRGKVYMQREL